jgi:pyruvate carboxylase subunit B
MRYIVTVSGRTVEMDLEDDSVVVDGRRMHAELAGGGVLRHLLLDGKSHPLLVRPGETRGAWGIELDGRRYAVEALDERTRAIRALTGTARTTRAAPAIRAPMPGLILRLEVAEGETVAAGQGVVIMEAMKMENELRADGGGVVSRIRVTAGQAVEKGAILMEFEAP